EDLRQEGRADCLHSDTHLFQARHSTWPVHRHSLQYRPIPVGALRRTCVFRTRPHLHTDSAGMAAICGFAWKNVAGTRSDPTRAVLLGLGVSGGLAAGTGVLNEPEDGPPPDEEQGQDKAGDENEGE